MIKGALITARVVWQLSEIITLFRKLSEMCNSHWRGVIVSKDVFR